MIRGFCRLRCRPSPWIRVYNLSMGYYRNNSQYDYGYWDKINARLNTEYTFNKL